MRVSIHWLRELLPQLSQSAEEIATALNSSGLEVEAIEKVGGGLEPLVFCKVLKLEPHPNRDKLRLVTLEKASQGSDEERYQTVVCGASNVPDPGGMVVLAPLGTHLPSLGFTLEPKSLGGVESCGMLVSEEELGLAEEADGILVYPENFVAPGTKFLSQFPYATDTILEIGVTPNRPDALGHLGVARELSAIYSYELKPTQAELPATSTLLEESKKVTVSASDRCPRYAYQSVSGVSNGASPELLRWRLHFLGLRSINCVVDITNWLMMYSGQPMHAFDSSKLSGDEILIRHAKAGESLKSLDGQEKNLDVDDLVIADASKPQALAGVIGGKESEVELGSTSLLLEAAYFTPSGVRRSARRHAFNTDSSYRFERGMDPFALEHTLSYATALLAQYAGAKSFSKPCLIDASAIESFSVTLRWDRVNALLGTVVPPEVGHQILERLGLKLLEGEAKAGSKILYQIPSFRPDLRIEEDLVEEVGRLYGLDKIDARLPKLPPPQARSTGKIEKQTRQCAAELGLSEAITYSFVSPSELEKLKAPPAEVTLLNPLSEDRSVLRTSLLPGLIEAFRRSFRRGEKNARLFTVGSRFLAPLAAPSSNETQAARARLEDDANRLPEERLSFAALLGGHRPSYLTRAEPYDIYDAKGIAERLLSSLTGESSQYELAIDKLPHLHPRGAAQITISGKIVGSIGPLHPEVCDEFKLEGAVIVIELDLAAIEAIPKKTPQFIAIPKLPSSSRDVAFILPDEIMAGKIATRLHEEAGPLCESVAMFDLFVGKDGSRSIAYRLVYRDPLAISQPDKAKTLADKDVEKAHTKAVSVVEKEFAIEARA